MRMNNQEDFSAEAEEALDMHQQFMGSVTPQAFDPEVPEPLTASDLPGQPEVESELSSPEPSGVPVVNIEAQRGAYAFLSEDGHTVFVRENDAPPVSMSKQEFFQRYVAPDGSPVGPESFDGVPRTFNQEQPEPQAQQAAALQQGSMPQGPMTPGMALASLMSAPFRAAMDLWRNRGSLKNAGEQAQQLSEAMVSDHLQRVGRNQFESVARCQQNLRDELDGFADQPAVQNILAQPPEVQEELAAWVQNVPEERLSAEELAARQKMNDVLLAAESLQAANDSALKEVEEFGLPLDSHKDSMKEFQKEIEERPESALVGDEEGSLMERIGLVMDKIMDLLNRLFNRNRDTEEEAASTAPGV